MPEQAKKLDLGALGTEILEVLKEELSGLIEAEGEDSFGEKGFVAELSVIAANAAATGNTERLAEVQANLPWIAERHRVRAVNAQWDTINKVLGIVVKGAKAAVASFLPISL